MVTYKNTPDSPRNKKKIDAEYKEIPMVARPKCGPLNKEEKRFIEENCGRLTIKDLGKTLRRSEKIVTAFIKREGLLDDADSSKQKIHISLKKTTFWKRIQKEFSKTELEYFSDIWCQVIEQFGGDVTPTEELQIQEYITFEIQKHRALLEQQKQILIKEDCERRYIKLMQVPSDQRDTAAITAFRNQIGECNNKIQLATNNFKELADKSQKTKDKIDKGRAERVKDMKNAKANWVNLLKAWQDHKIRKRVGEDMALSKKMMEANAEQLTKPIQFIDGKVDVPILNEKTADSIIRDAD